MGKIFTYEEIERRIVPKLDDLPKLANHIKARLTATKGIEGAVICGSVLSGNHTHRSDLDCVVVYDTAHTRLVRRVLGNLNGDAMRMNIPLEIIPTDIHLALRGDHSIGASFAKHLQASVERGGLINTNPLKFFQLDHANATEDARNYIRIKRQKVEKGLIRMESMETGELYRFLQKTMDAPFHAIRKLLCADGAEMTDDSKKSALKRFLEDANTNERKTLGAIAEIDSLYTAELAHQIKKLNPGQYLQLIREIKETVPAVLEFLRLCAFHLS